MSTLQVTDQLLHTAFKSWNKEKHFVLSYETSDLNDLKSGIISDKVFIYDLSNNSHYTSPKSKAQLLKFLIETL